MTEHYILQRFSDNRESTIGLLLRQTELKPLFVAYTLEDESRESKVSGETRIPEGKFEIIINRANTPKTLSYQKRFPKWFKYHLMLKDVPNFKGIYIHLGNFDDDTDGCILVGDVANNNRIGHGEVMSSTQAFQRLYMHLYDWLDDKNNNAFITIRNEKHLDI